MNEVAEKVAFITGGGSGIGFGMAKAFLKAGMKVVIADVRKDHLHAAASALSDAGTSLHLIQLDVTDRAAVARAADETELVFGKVHLLANNAGVNLFAPLDQCTYDDWDWILGVNLGGVINGIQSFVPKIKRHGEGGHVVNTGSMSSFISGPGAGIYTTSKFAVHGLTQSLRWSLAPYGIGVSLLSPGLVRSAIYESHKTRPPQFGNIGPVNQEFVKRLPEIHRAGMDPDEVGEKTLAGVQRNAAYIFTHPEFHEELRNIFDEILSGLPEGDTPGERMAFEESRRRANAEAKARMPA